MVTRAGANVKTKLVRASAAAVDNAATAEVVGRDLDFDPVAGNDADEVLAHAARNVGDYLVPVVEFDTELSVGQRLFYATLGLDRLFLRHYGSPADETKTGAAGRAGHAAIILVASSGRRHSRLRGRRH